MSHFVYIGFYGTIYAETSNKTEIPWHPAKIFHKLKFDENSFLFHLKIQTNHKIGRMEEKNGIH